MASTWANRPSSSFEPVRGLAPRPLRQYRRVSKAGS